MFSSTLTLSASYTVFHIDGIWSFIWSTRWLSSSPRSQCVLVQFELQGSAEHLLPWYTLEGIFHLFVGLTISWLRKNKQASRQTNKQNRQDTPYNPSTQHMHKLIEWVFAQWPVDKVPYRHRNAGNHRMWCREEIFELSYGGRSGLWQSTIKWRKVC